MGPEIARGYIERSGQHLWLATAIGWLDHLIAPQVVAAGGELHRRLRITTAMFVVALLLYPPWLITEALGGYWFRAGLGTASWSVIAGLLVLARRGTSPEWLGHGLGLALMAPTFVGIAVADAPYTPQILTLLVTPMALTLLASGRVGWCWCAASTVGFGLVALQTSDPDAREWIFALALSTMSMVGVGHAFEAVRRWAFDELRVARDEAKAAAQLKGRFLANMSHEIRTPMNGVLGMLDVLLESPLDGDQRDCAATAHASGLTLLEVINDVLDVSKMEAGQMVLEPRPFDLRDLLEDALGQVAVQAERKGLELVGRYVPGTPALVTADRVRVRQIVLNLVGNAIKYTERGHVLVTIERVDDSGFRLSVEDTGVGIPADQHSAIFEEFRQLDGSTTRTRGGTGLGLAIVRDLVTLMGGELGVTSREGQGSTFWCTLPLELSPGPEPQRPTGLDGPARVLVVDDEPISRRVLCEQLAAWGLATETEVEAPTELRVLVVDDNAINQKVAQRMLANLGCRVDVAGDGHQALARLEGTEYDMVFMDVQMPMMDGLEATAELRRREQSTGTHVPVVAMTAHAMSTDRDRCLAAGMDGYISKPMTRDDLHEMLEHYRG